MLGKMAVSAISMVAVVVMAAEAHAGLIVSLEPSGLSGDGATWTSSVGTSVFTRSIGDATLNPAAGGVQFAGENVAGIDVDDEVFRSNVDASNVDGSNVSGANPRTTEVWVLNPTIEDDEAVVGWGRRGATVQLHMMNYGASGGFGALGLWGAPDTGFDFDGNGLPAANEWHHIAYVYDGTTYSVYVDGALHLDRDMAIDTAPGVFNLFAQNQADGSIADPDDPSHIDNGQAANTNLSGSLNSVMIWDEARSASDILASFQAGPKRIPEPSTVAMLLAGLAAASFARSRR